MGVCLRVQKESNKGRFDSYSVRTSVLIISILPFGMSRAHFSDNLSRNSCIPALYYVNDPDVDVVTRESLDRRK